MNLISSKRAWFILLAALAMTVLEGAFRKWVPSLGGGAGKYLMYFSKDLIFAWLLFLPVRSMPSSALKTFEKWLVPGCILLVAGAAVSALHGINIVGAVLSARALIALPLLVWLVVPRLAGLPVRWVLWLVAALTALNFILGVEQNRLPADHILNRYADDTAAVVVVDTGVRATGTFAYITGLAVISAVGIWAGMALMSIARGQRERAAAWVAIVAGFGCGLASVSRAPIVIGVAMIGAWLVGLKDGLAIFWRGLLMGVICIAAAMALGLTSAFTELSQGLIERSATAGDSFDNRVFGQFSEMVEVLKQYPLGHGFGTEQVGGQYYATGGAGFNHFETPLPRLVMETGALGLIGYFLVCAGAMLALQRAKHNALNVGAKASLLATQVLLLPMFFENVIFNHTGSAFTWFILAAVLASREVLGGTTDYGQQTTDNSIGEVSQAKVRRRQRRIWRPEHAPFAARVETKDNETTDQGTESVRTEGRGQTDGREQRAEV